MYRRIKLEKFGALSAAFGTRLGVDGVPVLEEKHKRICSLSRDRYTSAVGSMPVLALSTHYMNTKSSPWELVSFRLGRTPVPPPHTAASVLAAVKKILEFLRVPTTVATAAVQDTTGNSLSVFNSVATAEAVPCFAHTGQLCTGHSVKDVESVHEAFKKVSANNAKIKGKPKRIEAVKAAGLLPPAVTPVAPTLHGTLQRDGMSMKKLLIFFF